MPDKPSKVSKRSTSDRESKSEPTSKREDYRRARWRCGTWVATFALLLSVLSYGMVNLSIRDDPFAPSSDIPWWEWLTRNQPHNALAAIPVVPIGARGGLAFRPRLTHWINSPQYPPFALGESAAKTSTLSFVSAALAQPSPPRETPAQAPREAPRELFVPKRPPGDPRPRVLHAQCSAEGEICWIGGDDTNPLWTTRDGGAHWSHVPGVGAPVSYVHYRPPSDLAVAVGMPPVVEVARTPESLLHEPGAAWEKPAPSFPVREDFRAGNVCDQPNLKCTRVAESEKEVSRMPNLVYSHESSSNVWYIFNNGSVANIKPDSHAPKVLSFSSFDGLNPPIRKLPTGANLRDIYFQDEKIGWITSGWHDGNEEGPRPIILQTQDGGDTWERLSYRRLPAPWVLYGALPALLLTFYGMAVSFRDIPKLKPSPGIEDIGWSDRPIGWDDPDILNLKPLARALSRFVRNRDTEPPLTVAVSGPWGSGKSSLMNLVAEDLRRTGTRTIFFNAWHHQKEEHLLAALLANIRDQAIPPAWRLSGLVFRARLLGLRLGKRLIGLAAALLLLAAAWLLFVEMHGMNDGLAASLKTWGARIHDAVANKGSASLEPKAFFEGLFGVGTVSATLALAVKVLSQAFAFTDPAKLMTSISRKARVSEFSEQLSFRYRFASEFSEVCRALRHGRNAGVVIMIDDLDRCRSSNVVEVLEAVNFLSSAGQCFIFLGIAKDKVIKAIAGELKSGTEEAVRYVEKLVNIEVFIPRATLNESKRLSLPPERAQSAIWPDRLRNALRSAPDMVLPAAFAVALLAALASSWPHSRGTSGAGGGGANPAVASGSSPSESSTGAGQATDSSGTPPPPPPVSPPKAPPGRLTADTPWAAYLVGSFALLAIGLAALRRSLNTGQRIVRDSEDFRAALEIWHPVIFLANPMPRSIKRHQNRLRFQAMRLRPAESEPDWLDRLFARGKPPQPTIEGTSPEPPLSDAKLVAISALDAAGHLDAPAKVHPPERPGNVPPEIADAIIYHYRLFMPDGVITEADIARVRDLLAPTTPDGTTEGHDGSAALPI